MSLSPGRTRFWRPIRRVSRGMRLALTPRVASDTLWVEDHQRPSCSCVLGDMPFEARESERPEFEQRLRTIAPSCDYKVLLVAAALHISERQLQRLVHASFGMSAGRWLKRQRMGAVLELLLDAPSVKTVSLAFGYLEASQFSRDFRNRFGCTPSSVLRQHAKLSVLAARLWSSDE